MQSTRHRLLVLGTGFAAFNLIKRAGAEFEVTVVSPRNHFLFTPLLPSTTVGTIEFRSIIEPIRHARRDLRFFHAAARSVDPAGRTIECRAADGSGPFTLRYDTLVIAVGGVSATYGVPGVAQHALFMKELHDARELRQRVIGCFERANLPVTAEQERRRLLHFVICGGGPTGVEVAAELNDFINEDLVRWYTHLVPDARITVVEAAEKILGTFDGRLALYAADHFRRQKIEMLTGSPVVAVDSASIRLKAGTTIPYGLLVWTTGNAPTEFVRSLDVPKTPRGKIVVDRFFRVADSEDLYALGDCCHIGDLPLPETSQVAQQQGKYLGRTLTRRLRGRTVEPFRYRHLGMLAYIGGNRALADFESRDGAGSGDRTGNRGWSGWATWIFWRSTYLTKIVSMKNKLSVLFDWFKARLFGRDISQF